MSDIDHKIEIIRKHIKSYQDFPKPGILFWDIFSILQNPEIFAILKDVLVQLAKEIEPPVDCVAALDARGFLIGPLIALELRIPFVPIRKKGKLPGKVVSIAYSLEYGEDTVEIQEESIPAGQRVLIVDDFLATGGSLKVACELVKSLYAEPVKCLVVMEIEALEGRKKIPVDATVEIQEDSIPPGTRVLIVDDLLATGGSLTAACKLIKSICGRPVKCLIAVEIEALEGRKTIPVDVISLIKI